MGLLVLLGYIFLIIPGIYLTVAYTWALALMADRGLGYWDAMKTSMRVVNRNFWETLLLALVVSIITSAGGDRGASATVDHHCRFGLLHTDCRVSSHLRAEPIRVSARKAFRDQRPGPSKSGPVLFGAT